MSRSRLVVIAMTAACGEGPPASGAPCPDGYEELPDLASCYRGDATQVSWVNARAICADEGAFLAIPDGGYEALAIATVAQNLGSVTSTWVGLSDLEQEDVWVTVLGDAAAFLPFRTGEPNGATNENCMLMKDVGYIDEGCTEVHALVCELVR